MYEVTLSLLLFASLVGQAICTTASVTPAYKTVPVDFSTIVRKTITICVYVIPLVFALFVVCIGCQVYYSIGDEMTIAGFNSR